MADAELQDRLVSDFIRLGASGYTLIPCLGAGRRLLSSGAEPNSSQVRIEVVVTRLVSDALLDYLRRDLLKEHRVTTCVETVDVVNPDQF